METFANGEAVFPKNCQNETCASYSPHLRQVVKQRPSFLANLLAEAGHRLAGLEQLLGQLQGGQDRHGLGVGTAGALLNVAELRVDVGSERADELVFVVGLERVTLPGDLDRDRTLHLGNCITSARARGRAAGAEAGVEPHRRRTFRRSLLSQEAL